MARKIVITSGKGGVGKTTVTAMLGARLAESGARVVMLDLDFGLNNLDVAIGVEDKVIYDITDAVEGRCRTKQAMLEVGMKNFFLMPSSHTFKREVTGQNVKLLIDGLSRTFDYILLDSSAGIDLGFHRAISSADEVIIVIAPSLASLRDADKVISILKSYKLDKVSAVANRIRGDLVVSGKQLSPKDIESALGIPLIGAIPDDDNVLLASNYNLPQSSRALKAFKYLADNVSGKKLRVYDCMKRFERPFFRRHK